MGHQGPKTIKLEDMYVHERSCDFLVIQLVWARHLKSDTYKFSATKVGGSSLGGFRSVSRGVCQFLASLNAVQI